MAGPPIEFRDIESIVDAWKLHDTPYYAIWQGSMLKFPHEEEDPENGERLLRENLQNIQESNTVAIYTLRTYRANALPITNKSQYKGSFTFRLSDPNIQQLNYTPNQSGPGVYVLNNTKPGPSNTVTGIDPTMAELLRQTLEQNQKLIQLFETKLIQEQEEEEEEEEEQEDKWMAMGNMIGTVAEKVEPIIFKILDRIFPEKNSVFMGTTEAATPEQKNAQLQQALVDISTVIGEDKLLTTLMKLADMAKSNPEKLKGLISML